MKRLICMMGLPRSGKSTVALTLGHPIVSPDALRLTMYNRPFWSPGEKLIWAHANVMVRALFEAGHETVVLDATNYSRAQRDQWRNVNWKTEFWHVPTSKEICLQRAIDNGQDELLEIIEMMDTRFEPLEEYEMRYEDGVS